MRGRLIALLILATICGFLSFYNNNRVVADTRKLSDLEKTFNAEKNINTELLVEHDDLRSGRHIASLVRVELSQFIPDQEQGKVIYVHEPAPDKKESSYTIIDLIASKAEAKNVEIMLD
ncbi:MAG: hypothetical protein PHT47_06335 [Candidatus Cloacimonetes bacterium]|jgi:hypothetical protein|nr:hypothetical protein [Candidatus Cloacimonadota bacterium]MDD4100695.1 hypothetical protein [Candidatus Cloacimonadota bacterium]MDD4806643.1 hypothetical protein [Candidatus Cloacimonadota bacterium]